METKIIRVADKGQISLPVGIRESLMIKKGDELLITNSSDTIVIKKVKKNFYPYSGGLRYSTKGTIFGKHKAIW